MDRLLTAQEVAERYSVSAATGRAYIRRMPGHMENPLRCTESQLLAWEAGRQVWEPERKKKAVKTNRVIWIPGVSRIPRRGAG